MSNSDAGGCLAILIPIGYIVAWLGSGYAAFGLVEPHSFGGILIFLIAWSVLGYIFQLLLLGLIAIVAESSK